MHFGITEKPMRDSILAIISLALTPSSKLCEQIATESFKYRFLDYIV